MPKPKILGNCIAPVPASAKNPGGGCRDADGNPRPAVAKGLCWPHYQQYLRAKKRGEPQLLTKAIRPQSEEPMELFTAPVKIDAKIAEAIRSTAKHLGVSTYEMTRRIYTAWYQQNKTTGMIPEDEPQEVHPQGARRERGRAAAAESAAL